MKRIEHDRIMRRVYAEHTQKTAEREETIRLLQGTIERQSRELKAAFNEIDRISDLVHA